MHLQSKCSQSFHSPKPWALNMNHVLPSDLFVDGIQETAVFLSSLILGKTIQ